MDAIGMELQKALVAKLGIVHQGISPIGVYFLQRCKMLFYGVAVSQRRSGIHVEEVLENERLVGAEGILIGLLLLLLLLLLHKIKAQEHHDKGYGEGHDKSHCTSATPANGA